MTKLTFFLSSHKYAEFHNEVHPSFTDEESANEAFGRRLCESKSSEHYGFSVPLSCFSDCETGFSYFGARYYDPTLLTSFLSIDRYADKYPASETPLSQQVNGYAPFLSRFQAAFRLKSGWIEPLRVDGNAPFSPCNYCAWNPM